MDVTRHRLEYIQNGYHYTNVQSNTTGVTSGAGTAFSLEHTSSILIFNWVCVVHLQLHVFLLLYDQKANKCPKYNGIGSSNIQFILAFNMHLFIFPLSTCQSYRASFCIALYQFFVNAVHIQMMYSLSVLICFVGGFHVPIV